MSGLRRVSSFSSSKIKENPIFSQLSQQQSTLDDGKRTSMYFVIPPGKTEENMEKTNLGEMFQACQAHFFSVQWIGDKECERENLTLPGDGNILVFDPFGSPAFHHWQGKVGSGSARLEILGPQVLRQVFNTPEVLSFQTKSVPTASLAMRKMIICMSGFKKEKKEELEKLVCWMNGTVSPSLTKAVTHVVTVQTSTNKCLEAFKEEIPVMAEEWVRQVWSDNQSAVVSAGDPRYVKFSCPIFYNVTVCMSQISAQRKTSLKAAIERFGGKATPELMRGKTDILVVMNPEGEKFKFARRWHIPCVTPEWIECSTDCGRLLPPEDFKVSPGGANSFVYTSTPANSLLPDFNLTRCSMIEPNQSKIDATNATIDFTRTNIDTHVNAVAELSVAQGRGPYLDGCRIYVVDFEKYDDLKKVLNKSGAVRLNQLSDGVTHVIVTGSKLPKPIKDRLAVLESMPYLVTVEWVLQSAKDGNPADEDVYKFEPEAPTIVNAEPNQSGRGNSNQGSAFATIHPEESKSTGSDTVTSDSTKSKSGRTSGGGTGSDDSDDSTTQDNPTTNSSFNPTVNEDSPGLLVGISFKVVLPDDEECKFTEDTIAEHSGTLVKENAEVVILPPACSSVEKEKADKAYTKFWLFECLESNSLNIEYSFHHVPLPINKKASGVMKNVVAAVSQYGGSERSYIIDLITAMGGRYQEVFAKKESKDMKNLRSTHLICKTMDTEKAKAAKRWGVPVVVAEWVTESFCERKRLNEERYNPEQQNTSDFTVFMPTPQRRQHANNIKPANSHNMSTKSVYPPSNRKPQSTEVINRKRDVTPEPRIDEKQDNQPGCSKNDKNKPAADSLPGPSGVPRVAALPVNKRLAPKCNDEEEEFELPPQEEIDRKMAELKAKMPYSDESFQQMLDDIKARGINLDDVSPFTSMEEARLRNLEAADSPLLLDLPRLESRALKEQFELALSLTPIVTRVKVKPRTSTPMSEIVRRFNAAIEADSFSSTPSQGGSPFSSTPKSNGVLPLRKAAAVNRHSFGSPTSSSSRNATNLAAALGVRRLDTVKRPSDGSPERDDNPKRQRTSSGQDTNPEDSTENKSDLPNENNPIKIDDNDVQEIDIDEDVPAQRPLSRKSERMDALTNLLAQAESGLSPTKRRSGEPQDLIPSHAEDEVCEEMEQPHLSWFEDNVQPVKAVNTNSEETSKIKTDEILARDADNQAKQGTRKRSSRLKKTSSVVNPGNGERVTRSRSQSKTRDQVPKGHQPIKLDDGPFNAKISKKKPASVFPVKLPEQPMFMLSSIPEKEKASATAAIERLGGKVSKVSCYDPNAVALVAPTLIRSEKILGCIAAGKLLLKLNYLTECEVEDCFLPITEEFLWKETNVEQDKERDLARASFNWFMAQSKDKDKKPMSGMKFCIVDQSKEKREPFKRLIQAGGGDVVLRQEDADLILKDDKSKAKTVEDIPVKNPLYLNTLILSDPPL